MVDCKLVADAIARREEAKPILLKAFNGARTAAQKRAWRKFIRKNEAEIVRLRKLLEEVKCPIK